MFIKRHPKTPKSQMSSSENLEWHSIQTNNQQKIDNLVNAVKFYQGSKKTSTLDFNETGNGNGNGNRIN